MFYNEVAAIGPDNEQIAVAGRELSAALAGAPGLPNLIEAQVGRITLRVPNFRAWRQFVSPASVRVADLFAGHIADRELVLKRMRATKELNGQVPMFVARLDDANPDLCHERVDHRAAVGR